MRREKAVLGVFLCMHFLVIAACAFAMYGVFKGRSRKRKCSQIRYKKCLGCGCAKREKPVLLELGADVTAI